MIVIPQSPLMIPTGLPYSVIMHTRSIAEPVTWDAISISDEVELSEDGTLSGEAMSHAQEEAIVIRVTGSDGTQEEASLLIVASDDVQVDDP